MSRSNESSNSDPTLTMWPRITFSIGQEFIDLKGGMDLNGGHRKVSLSQE